MTLPCFRWLLLLPALMAPAWAQDDLPRVSASLDRPVIYQGETVLLSIDINGDVDGDSPDVGRLTDQFTILDSRRSTRLMLLNGRPDSHTSWLFELEPKRTGKLQVPPIAIGRDLRTGALPLEVLPASAADSVAKSVFFDNAIAPADPYVQSQVLYIERFYYAVGLREGTISTVDLPPELELLQVGEPQRYIATRNGVNYRVEERRYALFPQRSGSYTIPPVTFRGRVSDPGRVAASGLTRGRRISIASAPLSLTVRPRPAAFPGDTWLPSAALTLQQGWAEEPPVFRVGEPVTRTLTLRARGLRDSQLPPLPPLALDGASVYPDQPGSESTHDDGWLTAQLTQRTAIVPTRAGDLTLPEIALHWWDTTTDQARVARLPAQTVTVLPAAPDPGQPSSPAPATAPDPATADPATADDARSAAPSTSPTPVPATAERWRWLALALLAIWLATLAGWWRERRRRPPTATSASTPAGDAASSPRHLGQAQARQRLLAACAAHDPGAAAAALLDWGRAGWPEHPPRGLGELRQRLAGDRSDGGGAAESGIAAPLTRLEEALYGPAGHAQGWRGDALARAAAAGLLEPAAAPQTHRPGDTLAPLYPD